MTYSDPFIEQYAEKRLSVTSPYVVENAFSDEECDEIIEIGENAYLFEGLVGGSDNVKRKHIRDSIVGFVGYSEDTSWIFDRLAHYAVQANNESWNFDLIGFGDDFQYTKYYGGGGHYSWHADIGETCSHRKISMVLQLCDETEYQGGDLQFFVGPGETSASKKRGTLIMFPSFLMHRVTPVDSGVRMSLVSWISGPNFR
jgi:PKHD-type hydroxylase